MDQEIVGATKQLNLASSSFDEVNDTFKQTTLNDDHGRPDNSKKIPTKVLKRIYLINKIKPPPDKISTLNVNAKEFVPSTKHDSSSMYQSSKAIDNISFQNTKESVNEKGDCSGDDYTKGNTADNNNYVLQHRALVNPKSNPSRFVIQPILTCAKQSGIPVASEYLFDDLQKKSTQPNLLQNKITPISEEAYYKNNSERNILKDSGQLKLMGSTAVSKEGKKHSIYQSFNFKEESRFHQDVRYAASFTPQELESEMHHETSELGYVKNDITSDYNKELTSQDRENPSKKNSSSSKEGNIQDQVTRYLGNWHRQNSKISKNKCTQVSKKVEADITDTVSDFTSEQNVSLSQNNLIASNKYVNES